MCSHFGHFEKKFPFIPALNVQQGLMQTTCLAVF